jgi:lipoate-protein ligase A
MALDEALLEHVTLPLLRTYTWEGDWVSFGYSQSYADVEANTPGYGLVRRWTGGGIVPHRPDWTFALIVPRSATLAQIRPIASYCQIHEAIAAALSQISVPTALSPTSPSGAQAACFAGEPAQFDVLAPGGTKLCGGAQRRTRHGFLHQGSLQQTDVPTDFGESLAQALSSRVEIFTPSQDTLVLTETLSREKYASPAWTHRIP